jgi:hypothetical protein
MRRIEKRSSHVKCQCLDSSCFESRMLARDQRIFLTLAYFQNNLPRTVPKFSDWLKTRKAYRDQEIWQAMSATFTLCLLLLILRWDVVATFAIPALRAALSNHRPSSHWEAFRRLTNLNAIASSSDVSFAYQSIFNFTDNSENAVSKFERIDDAVRNMPLE